MGRVYQSSKRVELLRSRRAATCTGYMYNSQAHHEGYILCAAFELFLLAVVFFRRDGVVTLSLRVHVRHGDYSAGGRRVPHPGRRWRRRGPSARRHRLIHGLVLGLLKLGPLLEGPVIPVIGFALELIPKPTIGLLAGLDAPAAVNPRVLKYTKLFRRRRYVHTTLSWRQPTKAPFAQTHPTPTV